MRSIHHSLLALALAAVWLPAVWLTVFLAPSPAWAAGQPTRDAPYTQAGPYPVAVSDAVWRDPARNRDIPVRVYAPSGAGLVPLIIFSHGLGGSRAAGEAWLRHWAGNGYVCLAVQHHGSDEELWRGLGPWRAMRKMREAASAAQLLERVRDVRFVLDESARRKASGEPALRDANLDAVGMSGHSFGAITTQVLAGQGGAGRDARIKAAMAFSPSSRKDAGEASFSGIAIPFLGVTGTADTLGGALLGDRDATPEDRRRVFDLLPPGGKYMLVFQDADHMVFGGMADPVRGRRRSESARAVSPHVVEAVKAASLAFWDLSLKGDRRAGEWLRSGLGSLLGPRDVFLSK